MDRYEIQKVVGQGSYGRAILCKRKKDSKQCIIKQISLAKLSKREAKMTEQEAQLLGKLSHPNIVAFWESFVNNSSLHIVMEFADGGDLDSYIKNYSKKSYGKEMPESQVLNLFVQVCLAIKHIHDRKILHRDLKGQNIFLTSSGLCKVGDFGVSRVLRSTIELAATQIGTPYYMSPEIMNNQKYNSKTDIWSLGVILYELVCLRLPFQGNSMKQLCYNIISGTPAPPPPSFSKDMKELLTAILAKDPKKRPSINHILSRSLIKNRIQNFLNETKIQREFSHTILHGVNVLHAPNSALNPSVAVANPPANPVVPQPPKPVVHAPPVVVNPKKDAPPPVVVQQSNTPAAVAARYRVMAPAAPSAPQRVQVPPQQRPSSAPKVAPPKNVDQIIREILNRDNERYRQNPVQQKVPVNNPNFNKPNVAVAQKQPVVANRPDSRGAPVIRQQPVKAPVPVQQNPVKMEVKANNNGNPFQAIVGGKPLALNQREPEKKPIVAAPKPAVPAQRKADDPPSNRRQEEKPRASPVVVTPSNNAAKVPMPNKVNKPPPDIEIVAAPPAARRIPVSRYNQPNAILPSPSQSPSVGNDDISVASKESNVSNAYRSPQVPLSQQRQIAVKSEGNSDRVGKIDAIIEKAAAVLEVIKKEKLKSEQMKIARQNTPSSNDREDYGYKEPPSRAAPSLQQYQPPQINRVVAAPSSSRQSMPAAVTPSNVSPVPSGAKADLPWLQNLQNQMGALKVQVQKLQDNKNSPIPSDPPSDLSPPPFQQSPAPATAPAPAPAPVAQLRKPPTVPSTRQSFPLDKNAISISSKNPSVVSKESNYSAGSNISNKKGPVKSITKPASVVSGSNKNNGGVKKPVEGVKGKVNSGTTNANKGKGENKKLKVSVQKKKKEPEGPSSKELLEQRKEMRQKHQMGFKEFLKAQREAKKRGGDEGAMGDDDEKEDDEESGDEDLEEQDDDEVEDEEQEDNEENEDFEEENDEYSQREADSAELSYDERNHSHDPIAAQKADVYIAPLSSASYENIEVTAINSNFPEKGNKKLASAKSVSRSSNDGDQSTGTTPTALNTTSSKYLQNPKFRQSFPSKDNVNVLIDDNIEILSPPKPPTTRQMQPPPLPLPGNNSGTSSAASSARSQYHIPEGVTDSKNFYKSRSNVSLQGANNSPVISVEESNDACCGKVFTNMFRSNNTNANANSQINAKIVPTSPIRGRNMAFEFTEEELKNTNNKSMSDRSKAKAMLDEDENGELPEQSEADREREQYDMELDYQEQLLLQHPLINSEETEERDTEEEDYLGKSFVLQVQSNQKDNMEIDEETALEYSMMLQQMQEILQLPSQKSFMSPMKSSPRALEAVKEGENEEEDDDDCFEEKAFTFYLSDSDEEDAQKEGEAYMEEFEVEQDDNNEPVALLHEPRTQKSFLTQHLSYTHTIPKPKPKVKDTEDVVEESQADVEVDSLNADRHEDDYQTLIEDSLQLSQRLIDLLGYEVFSRGMSFLSSNEMIDESLDEDEILVKLEGILGVENLAYIEEMYQLLTYQQLIQEEEKGRLSQKEEAEEEIISERNRRPIRDVALEEI